MFHFYFPPKIQIILQHEQIPQRKYWYFFPPAIQVFNLTFENSEILLHFILSNCGEFYQKAKNVKYVWSAQLPGQDSRAAMEAASVAFTQNECRMSSEPLIKCRSLSGESQLHTPTFSY